MFSLHSYGCPAEPLHLTDQVPALSHSLTYRAETSWPTERIDTRILAFPRLKAFSVQPCTEPLLTHFSPWPGCAA